uniref:Uncharacterized protein n=1 Tax=Arundo donax TaxID=35708 RepID=A0A0A9E879_ARUDO
MRRRSRHRFAPTP